MWKDKTEVFNANKVQKVFNWNTRCRRRHRPACSDPQCPLLWPPEALVDIWENLQPGGVLNRAQDKYRKAQNYTEKRTNQSNLTTSASYHLGVSLAGFAVWYRTQYMNKREEDLSRNRKRKQKIHKICALPTLSTKYLDSKIGNIRRNS